MLGVWEGWMQRCPSVWAKQHRILKWWKESFPARSWAVDTKLILLKELLSPLAYFHSRSRDEISFQLSVVCDSPPEPNVRLGILTIFSFPPSNVGLGWQLPAELEMGERFWYPQFILSKALLDVSGRFAAIVSYADTLLWFSCLPHSSSDIVGLVMLPLLGYL